MIRCAILCGGGEPVYSSSQGFIHALKSLGHYVWTVGRSYFGRNLCDVELPQRTHPELYSYSEVLSETPYDPDLVICFDPGGFFCGEKPKGLKSVFCSTDAHRCGEMIRYVLKEGNYDLFYNMQPNYSHYFTDLVKVHTSLPAFDERRFSQEEKAAPEVDVVFVGQTGLAITEDHWKTSDGQDEVGKYISNLVDRLPPDRRKYEFSYLPSYDYSERGELLYRLSRDFSVRIYEPLWDERLQIALQKGRVGFNCSILCDISLRNFEVAASGRPLVTDEVTSNIKMSFNQLGSRPYPPSTYGYFSGLYKPFYGNFSLIYQEVKKMVEFALQRRGLEEAREYREGVFANHSWKARAQELLRLFNL